MVSLASLQVDTKCDQNEFFVLWHPQPHPMDGCGGVGSRCSSSSAYHYSQYYHYILLLIFLPAPLQQHLLLPLLLLPLLVLVTSPSLTAIQVALEDLVLGAPGSPASPDLKDLIIVTGVGNNSPGVLPGWWVVEHVALRWWGPDDLATGFYVFTNFANSTGTKGTWRLYHHRSYLI